MEFYRLVLFLVALGAAFFAERITARKALAGRTPTQRFAASLAVAGVVYLVAAFSHLDRIALAVIEGRGANAEDWAAFLVVGLSFAVAAYLMKPVVDAIGEPKADT